MWACSTLAPPTIGATLTAVNHSFVESSVANGSAVPFAIVGGATTVSYLAVGVTTPLIFLRSQSMERVGLLTAPPLAFNISLTSAAFQLLYYYVGNVTAVQGATTSGCTKTKKKGGL